MKEQQESLQLHMERAVGMHAEQGEARAHLIANAASLETKAAMEMAREAQVAAESARQLADSWQVCGKSACFECVRTDAKRLSQIAMFMILCCLALRD